jgi:Putative phage abortive infection protein
MRTNHTSSQQEVEANRQLSVSQALPFVAIGVFILLCCYYFDQLLKHAWKIDQATLGQFGDFIGGILNPIIAMFALIALVVGVGLQRTVLVETRKELKITQEIALEQSKTADQQRREQRFFDLLNLYQRTVDSLTYTQRSHPIMGMLNKQPTTTNIFHGKSAIDEWLERGQSSGLRNFSEYGFAEQEKSEYCSIRNITHLIEKWRNPAIGNFIDQYFRIIYRILIEAETLLGEDHFRYIKLLRAQLNQNELTILAYNMWLDNEGINMRPLAEKYGLLKHLPEGKLREEVTKVLSAKVFGNVNLSEQINPSE